MEEKRWRTEGRRNGEEKRDERGRKWYGLTGISNVISKHVEEFGQKIYWNKTTCLEKQKRFYRRNILENSHIKGNRNTCMNLNDGLVLRSQNGNRKEAQLNRGSQDSGETIASTRLQFHLKDVVV